MQTEASEVFRVGLAEEFSDGETARLDTTGIAGGRCEQVQIDVQLAEFPN